jgi:cyclase
MLTPRIIPCLLIRNGGLVKTKKFQDGKYVGDPLNAVRIFNEKEVDELILLDIDATVQGRSPSLDMVRRIAAECRMPLCYGGGVKTVSDFEQLVELGVEKVAISTSAIRNMGLIASASERVGSQSVVVVIDVRRIGSEYRVFVDNGRVETEWEVGRLARHVESLGAGEVVINSIDKDGLMGGYDLELIQAVRSVTSCPLTALGGAGSLKDLADVVRAFDGVGVAAGSLFVFKGVYRAVLINYPSKAERVKYGL